MIDQQRSSEMRSAAPREATQRPVETPVAGPRSHLTRVARTGDLGPYSASGLPAREMAFPACEMAEEAAKNYGILGGARNRWSVTGGAATRRMRVTASFLPLESFVRA